MTWSRVRLYYLAPMPADLDWMSEFKVPAVRLASTPREDVLYLILDAWSRKIMSVRAHSEELSGLAVELFKHTCRRHGLDPEGVMLHSYNGRLMKGSDMLVTLKLLCLVASFSRPWFGDDNLYSEALFCALKNRFEYPSGPFASLKAARLWVAGFVRWYNTEHRHSDWEEAILKQRQCVYERLRRRDPRRWSGATRNQQPIKTVVLNPEKNSSGEGTSEKAA